MKRTVAIIGGGSCALMLGCELDPKKYQVTIFEKNKTPGRKFLVAGYGGLNITHSEEPAEFILRYLPQKFMEAAFGHFSNKDLVRWLHALGIETYTGSSGRVFPDKDIKPVEVLDMFLKRIAGNKYDVLCEHEWKGFSDSGELRFKHHKRIVIPKADIVIFCLGGASWPVTGSKGDWTEYFEKQQVVCLPFMPSNCAFRVDWDETLLEKIEGRALKNCRVNCGNKEHAGEIVLTRFGIEGSGIYPFSALIREQLHQNRRAVIHVDLKPLQSKEQLLEKLQAGNKKKTYTERLKIRLNLSDAQLALLKNRLSKEEFLNEHTLIEKIKRFEIPITGLAPVDKGISTVGGISLDEIDEHFELKKMKGHYAIGKMLDYDAPTGGYLLQSCFSMAKYVADHLNTSK